MEISLGSAAIGLVWGWLLVLIGGRAPGKRPLRNVLALTTATLLSAALIFFFKGGFAILIFFVAVALAGFLHLGWLRTLSVSK